MKACIDECPPNTSQTNYSEGFWRITSKINAKIEVRKQLESVHANRRSPTLCHMFLKWRRFPFCFAFASLFAVKFLLILMNSISKFMSACLKLDIFLGIEETKHLSEVNMESRGDAKGLC